MRSTGWLNDLQSASNAKQSRAKPNKSERVEPNGVYITVRNPKGDDDLGETREGFYGELPDGSVTLCDHKGNPKGRVEYVGENETPAQAAWRLLREQVRARRQERRFPSPAALPEKQSAVLGRVLVKAQTLAFGG